MSQASVAQIITRQVDRRGISRPTATANAMRPILPIGAPAASRPSASLPRIVPSKPCCCFFSRVFNQGRTGWENRRKGQEQASDSGIRFVGSQSAGDCDGSAECKSENVFVPFRSRLIFIALSQGCVPKPEGGSRPYEDRRTCNGKGRQLVPDEQPTPHTKRKKKAIAPTIMERASVCA
jgi:hypothetical protein